MTATVRYANAGYELTPPPASSHAKTSAAAAYAQCLKDAVCVVGASPVLSLAVVTGANRGGHINPDGSVTPFLNHTLAWVVSYTGEPCVGSSPPTRAPASGFTPTSAPVMSTCTIVNFISADSGKVVLSMSGPDL